MIGGCGLVRRERLWRETEDGRDREWDICLYRIGPLLEVPGLIGTTPPVGGHARGGR